MLVGCSPSYVYVLLDPETKKRVRLAHGKSRSTETGKKKSAARMRRYRATLEGRVRSAIAIINSRARAAGYSELTSSFEEILSAYAGRCAICDRPESGSRARLGIDHCHITGVFRGWLCHPCNAGLGLFSDEPDRLIAAGEYVRRTYRLRDPEQS